MQRMLATLDLSGGAGRVGDKGACHAKKLRLSSGSSEKPQKGISKDILRPW